MALSRINAKSIADGTIVAADIADGSITTAKIADANVTTGKIVSVANTQITGNITSSQIVPDPVFNGNTTVTNIITGAGTVGAPSIAPTGDTNTGIYFPAADNIGFATGGTIRGRWTTDGLCFGSDTAAANALDDYEEGTWTPTLPNGGTLTVNSATYTKIGRQVTVTFYVTLVAPTNNGSEFQIGGLPFSNVNIAGYYMGGSFAYVGDANLTGWMPVTGTGLDVIYFHAQGVTSQRTNAQYITASGSTDSILASITYWAS